MKRQILSMFKDMVPPVIFVIWEIGYRALFNLSLIWRHDGQTTSQKHSEQQTIPNGVNRNRDYLIIPLTIITFSFC